jgi:hypothetical protein
MCHIQTLVGWQDSFIYRDPRWHNVPVPRQDRQPSMQFNLSGTQITFDLPNIASYGFCSWPAPV